MKKTQILTAGLTGLMLSGAALTAPHPDSLLSSLSIDQLEQRKSGDDETWALESEAWIGGDLNKFVVKLEGEKEVEEENLEVQALYSRALAPYWNLQLGLRQDLKPDPERSWGVISLQGLAPYFFEVDAALFVGESGHSALRLEAEYELLITQRWILSPEVELNFYGKDDEDLHRASGLADAEAGLRLRYEVRREFAPYVGVNWHKSFGDTADLLEAVGEDDSDTQWLVGIKAWF